MPVDFRNARWNWLALEKPSSSPIRATVASERRSRFIASSMRSFSKYWYGVLPVASRKELMK